MSKRPDGVVVETSMGDFAIELYWNHAPQTCKKFMGICRESYYDNTTFHRVIKNFMIQGGDPSGTGKGGLDHIDVDYSEEITKELKHTGAGIVAMAGKTGSQFYITLAPTPWLDGKHTIFGRISAGMRVIERLGLVPVDPNDRPSQEIKFYRCYPYKGKIPELNKKQTALAVR